MSNYEDMMVDSDLESDPVTPPTTEAPSSATFGRTREMAPSPPSPHAIRPALTREDQTVGFSPQRANKTLSVRFADDVISIQRDEERDIPHPKRYTGEDDPQLIYAIDKWIGWPFLQGAPVISSGGLMAYAWRDSITAKCINSGYYDMLANRMSNPDDWYEPSLDLTLDHLASNKRLWEKLEYRMRNERLKAALLAKMQPALADRVKPETMSFQLFKAVCQGQTGEPYFIPKEPPKQTARKSDWGAGTVIDPEVGSSKGKGRRAK